MGNTNSSASDIITYIGVPLAVLGVLPILYNTLATLAALSRIRRMLRHSRLTALTRSDVVNRVIEVDLPRYAVTPWHRSMHRSAYWSLASHPSTIPGGSWSVFNWNTNTIGIRTQRVEYADQLRQPQVEGLIAAQHELDPESPSSSHSDPDPESPLDNLSIEHLRPATTATWFASAATAYGTSARTLLWSHRIPETLLSFVRRASIPCGVLELISLVDPSATPEWGTLSADDSEARRVELMMRRMREQRGHMEKEARMSVAERQQAIKTRMERENLQRLDDFRDKMHADLQRKEARLLEALQSPKWTPAQLAPHALRWLKENSAWGSIFSSVPVPEGPVSWSLKPVLGPLLHTIVLNDELSSRLVAALESWKAWSENGGMRRADIDALMKDANGDREAFALASLVAAGNASECGQR
ncbi:hypothetical protein ACHAQF_005239 [Verticillium nonalfalfae]